MFYISYWGFTNGFINSRCQFPHIYFMCLGIYTLTMNIYWLEAIYTCYGSFKTVSSFTYYWKKAMTMSCWYTVGNNQFEAFSFPTDYTMAHKIIKDSKSFNSMVKPLYYFISTETHKHMNIMHWKNIILISWHRSLHTGCLLR